METQKCTFIIRNLSPEIRAELTKIAKEKHVSREQLARTILASAVGMENSVQTRKYYKNKETQKQAQ